MVQASRAIIDPVDIRLYSLLWRPGAVMHAAWWNALSLDVWQAVYQHTGYCRRWIDRAIATRRGFPAIDSTYQLSPVERRLLSVVEKLPRLLLALGLLRLGQPEYWMLKLYREAVQPRLDSVACSQLSLFSARPMPSGFRVHQPMIEPARLADSAGTYGAVALASALPNSMSLRAVEILLPPGYFDGQRLLGKAASFALDMLLRLARFL